MFGIIADSLTTITSVLLPVFASYKALRSSDPAQVTPWLMYWTTLSLFLAGENFFYPILSWMPFYSWIRLGVHLYLVLPGQQGSVYLYRRYLDPWLEQHERQIDDLIVQTHDKAKAAGLGYINQAIELVRTRVLGLPPKQPTPPHSRNVSYSQALLSRFSMPSARGAAGFMPAAAAGGANDLFAMLGNVMQQATSTAQSRDAQAADLSASGHLIPANISGQERSTYINTQRDRLKTLLAAFDTAAYQDQTGGGPTGATTGQHGVGSPATSSPYGAAEPLKKSKSEAEFEDLAGEDVPHGATGQRPAGGQDAATWGKWIWGQAKDAASQAAAAQERKAQ